MNYQETLKYLYEQLPMYQRVGQAAYKKDLTNTLELCHRLGNPHQKIKTVHVAGTNGKGSVSHGLAAILQQAGYKTGLYTSPHLKDFTERIRINGNPIPQKDVVDFVANHQPEIEAVKPSFFELTVVMAFDFFAKEQVDIAIIEVGLGGRLDSTNVLQPLVAVITNISMDHQDMLGDTLPAIAMEKAGIIKAHIPTVIGQSQAAVAEVFVAKSSEKESKLFFADQRYQVKNVTTTKNGLNFDVFQTENKLLERATLDLGGIYQQHNIPAVLQTIELLASDGYEVGMNAIIDGFANIKRLTGLKGRWQTLQEKPLMICDTGHNEVGINQVVQQLNKMKRNRLHIVFGMVKDKDSNKILQFLPQDAVYYFCAAGIPRALPATKLKEKADQVGLKGDVYENVNQAINAAKANAGPEDLIFIGGSSFVVAEIDQL